MSAELAALLREAARKETLAAQSEFPLTDDIARGFVRAAGRRRVAITTMAGVGCAAVAGGLALGVSHFSRGDDAGPVAPPSPSMTQSESASASPSPTATTPSPTPSASPSPSVTQPPPSTTPPVVVDDPPAVPVPPQVTIVSASPGGGSGEILVDWGAVDGATGYRVYRSASPDGPFSRAASVTVSTGSTTVELGIPYENIQIWQPSATSFEYVESVDGSRAYFRVAAFNSAGAGEKSAVVCGAPSTAAEGC